MGGPEGGEKGGVVSFSISWIRLVVVQEMVCRHGERTVGVRGGGVEDPGGVISG